MFPYGLGDVREFTLSARGRPRRLARAWGAEEMGCQRGAGRIDSSVTSASGGAATARSTARATDSGRRNLLAAEQEVVGSREGLGDGGADATGGAGDQRKAGPTRGVRESRRPVWCTGDLESTR